MKNMLKKSLIIGFTYFCALLFNACCHCDGIKSQYYSIEKIEALNSHFSFKGDSSFIVETFMGDSISKDNYGLQINLDTKRIAANTSTFFQLSSTYACKCTGDYLFLNDSLTAFHIKTLLDFDATHPAGSNVDEYFRTLLIMPDSGKNYIEYQKLYAIPFFNIPNQIFQLFLKTPPASGQKVLFEISLQTGKGKTYTSTTNAITLL
ncbi:MAG: DUF5034 domain-containing protein [Chitinophagaceae bacterium]|jgi:hypothetical protein